MQNATFMTSSEVLVAHCKILVPYLWIGLSSSQECSAIADFLLKPLCKHAYAPLVVLPGDAWSLRFL